MSSPFMSIRDKEVNRNARCRFSSEKVVNKMEQLQPIPSLIHSIEI